jgi:type II secretory pathway pseudopilin PulG
MRRARLAGGFSTIEAMVALLLLSLVGLIAVEAVSGGRRASGAGSARAAAAVRLLQADTALRRAVGEIRVPYWVGHVEAAAVEGGFSLPYRDGEEARSLRVAASAGWIVLDAEGDGTAVRRLGPFAEASVEPVFDDGRLWGVKAIVRAYEGGDPVELRARIGSRAVPSGGAP